MVYLGQIFMHDCHLKCVQISIDTKEITFGTATIHLICFKNYKGVLNWQWSTKPMATLWSTVRVSLWHLSSRGHPHRPPGDVLGNSGQEGVISIQRKGATIWVNDFVSEFKLCQIFILLGCNCHIYLWDESPHINFQKDQQTLVFLTKIERKLFCLSHAGKHTFHEAQFNRL